MTKCSLNTFSISSCTLYLSSLLSVDKHCNANFFFFSSWKDWDDDELDQDTQRVEDDPENCAVDENFDPEAAVEEPDAGPGRVRSSSGPILIGPLTFEDRSEPEDELDVEPPQKQFPSNANEKHHHLASHYRYFSSRHFSGGTRGTPPQRNHGLCLSLSDHDRIKIFVHELGYRGLLQYVERLMRHLNDQVKDNN